MSELDIKSTQLIALDPEKYVGAVFAPFRERLQAAKAAAVAVTEIDVTTTPGMQVAIKHRAALRTIRVEVEKARKLRKEPILEISRLLDGRAKELTAEIQPEEDRFDAAIKAEETRKEREREAREQAELARIAGIQEAIARYGQVAASMVGKPSAEIASATEELRKVFVGEWAFEFKQVAQEALDKAIATLTQLHAGAVAQEQAAAAEAARVKAEREELARLRAEQEELQRQEAARIAAETRRRAEEEAAHRAKIEEAERTSRAKIEEEQRQERLARQAREETERVRQQTIREAEEKLRAERQAAEDKLRAERERVEAEKREIARQQAELDDGATILRRFVERFGKRREFAAVVKAINTYLTSTQERAA